VRIVEDWLLPLMFAAYVLGASSAYLAEQVGLRWMTVVYRLSFVSALLLAVAYAVIRNEPSAGIFLSGLTFVVWLSVKGALGPSRG
jgi:hypothetical protein